MSVVLEIKNLTKQYGKFKAVNNLSLTVESGQVYGLLGPNGCGKTTTLGMILDVINSSSGEFVWFGDKTTNNRHKIGSILEHPIFYPELSGYKNLEIAALIKKVSKENIEKVLTRVGLWKRKDSPFKTYSLGMKQRLALASALLSDPEVLVLDEPTNGLDAQGVSQMRKLILSIAEDGKTIIISSHLLDEIQKMCSHYAILKEGNLIQEGTIAGITASKNAFYFKTGSENYKEVLAKHPLFTDISLVGRQELVSFSDKVTGAELNKFCFDNGVLLAELLPHTTTLEEEFLDIVQ